MIFVYKHRWCLLIWYARGNFLLFASLYTFGIISGSWKYYLNIIDLISSCFFFNFGHSLQQRQDLFWNVIHLSTAAVKHMVPYYNLRDCSWISQYVSPAQFLCLLLFLLQISENDCLDVPKFIVLCLGLFCLWIISWANYFCSIRFWFYSISGSDLEGKNDRNLFYSFFLTIMQVSI